MAIFLEWIIVIKRGTTVLVMVLEIMFWYMFISLSIYNICTNTIFLFLCAFLSYIVDLDGFHLNCRDYMKVNYT